MYKPTNPHKLAAIRVMQEEELAWAKSIIAKQAEQEWIDAYCTNCHWHGLRTSLVRRESEPDFPPRCCPKCKEESIEDFAKDIGEPSLCPECGSDVLCECVAEDYAVKYALAGLDIQEA
jgi:predicted Rdx family selenoprotein